MSTHGGTESGGPVDLSAFGRDLLAVFDQRRVSLREAARQAGVPPIVLSRVTQYADPCSLTNFALLCAWSGLPADGYIARAERMMT